MAFEKEVKKMIYERRKNFEHKRDNLLQWDGFVEEVERFYKRLEKQYEKYSLPLSFHKGDDFILIDQGKLPIPGSLIQTEFGIDGDVEKLPQLFFGKLKDGSVAAYIRPRPSKREKRQLYFVREWEPKPCSWTKSRISSVFKMFLEVTYKADENTTIQGVHPYLPAMLREKIRSLEISSAFLFGVACSMVAAIPFLSEEASKSLSWEWLIPVVLFMVVIYIYNNHIRPKRLALIEMDEDEST